MAKNYVMAFDLGSNSCGVAALEVDAFGMPLGILHAESVIHKGGVGGTAGEKTSRKAVAGEIRRSQNRLRHNKFRKKELDAALVELGLPTKNDINWVALKEHGDMLSLRSLMATTKLSDDIVDHAVSAVAHHMLNHRGYRNPWQSVNFLLSLAKAGYSARYHTFIANVEKELGLTLPVDATPSQVKILIRELFPSSEWPEMKASKPKVKGKPQKDKTPKEIKEESRLCPQPLHRADFIRELDTILTVQDKSELFDPIARAIAFQELPGVAAEGLAKKCIFEPGEVAARKASLAFQEFRIADQIGNLRTKSGNKLTSEVKNKLFDFLNSYTESSGPSWEEVILTAGEPLRGYSTFGSPAYNKTNATVVNSKNKELISWWGSASLEEREVFIHLVNGTTPPAFLPKKCAARVSEWLATRPEPVALKIEGLNFEDKRASFSEIAMRKITQRILASDDLDSYYAFIAEYGKAPSDQEVPSHLGAVVGNPCVDTNIKIVQSAHDMLVSKFGKPSAVVVETSRELATSELTRQATAGSNTQRRNEKVAIIKDFNESEEGKNEKVANSRRNVLKIEILQAQHGQCMYCGTSVEFSTMELDHIIPVASGGVSHRFNLVASCRKCNHSKSNLPFPAWSKMQGAGHFGEVESRIKSFYPDKAKTKFLRKQYLDRLKLLEETERPTESVSWTSKELRKRFAGLYGEENVYSPTGFATAEARRVGGINDLSLWLRLDPKTKGKPREDRRHHAIDALVMCVLDDKVIETLQTRQRLRNASDVTDKSHIDVQTESTEKRMKWSDYTGYTQRDREYFANWANKMDALRELMDEAMEKDLTANSAKDLVIKVSIRQRKGLDILNAHKDGISSIEHKQVTDEFSVGEINRVYSTKVRQALVNHQDFDPKKGLPENPARWIGFSVEKVKLYSKGNAPRVPVRGGSAILSPGSVNHIRIYKDGKSVLGVPAFGYELHSLREKGAKGSLYSINLPEHGPSQRAAHGSRTASTRVATIQTGDTVSIPVNKLLETNENGDYVNTSGVAKNCRKYLELWNGRRVPKNIFLEITGFQVSGGEVHLSFLLNDKSRSSEVLSTKITASYAALTEWLE